MRAGGATLWRIAKHTPEYAATDLSGDGAKAHGGRWNSKGVAALYASTSISLATLETLAHMGEGIAIRNAFLVQITVPAGIWKLREMIEAKDLPVTWSAEPPGMTTINFGDQWLSGATSPLLLVPSVIIPEEFNVLINPAHAKTKRLSANAVRQFVYDPRL